MLWNIWCLNEQNAQMTKTVKEFEKVHSTVWHISRVLLKLKRRITRCCCSLMLSLLLYC